jgi:pilus assembly protein CpaE
MMIKEEIISKKEKEASSTGAYIISVASSKGGVGKTSLCLCLSYFTSKRLGRKTLLLEYDSSPGDFSAIFDIEPDKSLKMAFKFPEKFKSYVKNISKNLDVLRGLPDPVSAEGIRENDTLNLFKVISTQYDYIIIDTQTVLNGMVLDVLALSSRIFLVTEYSIESISRAAGLFDFITERFNIDHKRIRVIFNKKRVLRFLRIRDISRILKIPVSAYFVEDNRFDKSLILLGGNQMSRTRFYRQVEKFMSLEDKRNP